MSVGLFLCALKLGDIKSKSCYSLPTLPDNAKSLWIDKKRVNFCTFLRESAIMYKRANRILYGSGSVTDVSAVVKQRRTAYVGKRER